MEKEILRVFDDDLVFSILAMQPVKSLMRFKCVCKSWYALISEPYFIATHTNRRKDQSILLVRKHSNGFLKPWGFEPFLSFLSNETMEVLENVFLPFPSKFDSLIVYGPCNGILCLQTRFHDGHDHNAHYDRDVALWNPATREFNLIPATQVARSLVFDRSERNVGFCYDPKSDDFKVVRIETFYHEELPRHNPYRVFRYLTYMVEVYSLRSNCWREIKTTIPLEQADFIGPSYGFSSCLNGVQYWCTADEIVSFDFEEQVFGGIAYPQDTIPESIAVFNDSLALVSGRDVTREFNIWVMNEERNWSLLVKLDFNDGDLRYRFQFHSLVGFWSNDKFFFLDQNGYLCLYDSSTLESKLLQIHCLDIYNDDFSFYFRTVAYEESLVSVKGRIEPLVPAYISLPESAI